MNKFKLLIGMLFLSATLCSASFIIDLGKTTGTPSDLTSEYNRLLGQITDYNLSHTPDLTAPSINNGVKTEITDVITSIDFDFNQAYTGYLMFKWGGIDQFYYVNDLVKYTFNSTVSNGHGGYLGLSHWDKWENVPEAKSSLILLGLTIVGVVGFRKQIAPLLQKTQ